MLTIRTSKCNTIIKSPSSVLFLWLRNSKGWIVGKPEVMRKSLDRSWCGLAQKPSPGECYKWLNFQVRNVRILAAQKQVFFGLNTAGASDPKTPNRDVLKKLCSPGEPV